MKIRIKFKKFGNVKFIGHLDVQRFFQKAVRRAQIDVTYTEGFSPHQIMSFAAPLGVGLESNGEYMDMEVASFLGSDETVKRLNAVSAEGIEIVSAKVLPEGTKNAMASVAAAGYSIRFREGREPSFPWQKELMAFALSPSIVITKETKSGTAEIDIRPGIYELTVLPDDTIYMLLDASSSGIKPSMVLNAFLAIHGESLPENALLITREDTYTNKSEDILHPEFISLDMVGSKQ